jgi:hypothetical protein
MKKPRSGARLKQDRMRHAAVIASRAFAAGNDAQRWSSCSTWGAHIRRLSRLSIFGCWKAAPATRCDRWAKSRGTHLLWLVSGTWVIRPSLITGVRRSSEVSFSGFSQTTSRRLISPRRRHHGRSGLRPGSGLSDALVRSRRKADLRQRRPKRQRGPVTARRLESRRDRRRRNEPCGRPPQCCGSHRIRRWLPCRRTSGQFQLHRGDAAPTR